MIMAVVRSLFVSFSLCITMAGCTQKQSYEMGPDISDEELHALGPETSREDVIEKYGPPSFRCFTPNNHNICYFHQKKNKNDISEQRQVEILFDDQGKVKEVRVYEPDMPKKDEPTESQAQHSAA